MTADPVTSTSPLLFIIVHWFIFLELSKECVQKSILNQSKTTTDSVLKGTELCFLFFDK